LKYEQIVQAVYHQPWAILPEAYATILELVRFRAEGNRLSKDEIQARIEAALQDRPERESRGNRGKAIAVLPLYGVISQRMNLMMAMSGGTSTEQFGTAFKAAVADPAIGGIVIDIDSPGGAVVGVQELWQTIMSARGQKPIVAFANSLAASGAYWIATAADEIVVTPGGDVGSIGVLTAHTDSSARLEQEGESVTLISAGKKKADLSPFGPLSARALTDLQERVDEIYGTFVGAVAKGRGTTAGVVRAGFGEGGLVGAKSAVRDNMADRIGTMDLALERAASPRTMTRAEFLTTAASYKLDVEGFDRLLGALEDIPVIKGATVTQAEAGPELHHYRITEARLKEYHAAQEAAKNDLALRKRRLELEVLTRP